MADPGPTDAEREIAFEAYGLCLAVSTSEPELLERVRRFLPPNSQPCPPEAVQTRFSITDNGVGTYSIGRDGQPLNGTRNLELDLALEILDSQLRIYLGRKAPDLIFVHAGAVAHRGLAIVLPGQSFAGKTSLVVALVRAGAVYYSDEFAVIDRDGLLIPYAKALSVRINGQFGQTDHAIESYGGVAGTERVPVAMIVMTSYRAGAEWSPKRLSPGAGALALLANAVPARERSAEVMETVSCAAEGSVVIESERDEADAVAALLLGELERHTGHTA